MSSCANRPEMARAVVRRRPDMPVGRSLLAQALLEKGEITEALEVMRQARADGAVTETLLRQLGLTLAESPESGECFRPYGVYLMDDPMEYKDNLTNLIRLLPSSKLVQVLESLPKIEHPNLRN